MISDKLLRIELVRKEDDLNTMKKQLDSAFAIIENQQKQIAEMRQAIALKGIWKSLLHSIDVNNKINDKIYSKKPDNEPSSSNQLNFYDDCATAITWLSADVIDKIHRDQHIAKSMSTLPNESTLENMLCRVVDAIHELNMGVRECKRDLKENKLLRQRIHSLSATTKILSDKVNQLATIKPEFSLTEVPCQHLQVQEKDHQARTHSTSNILLKPNERRSSLNDENQQPNIRQTSTAYDIPHISKSPHRLPLSDKQCHNKVPLRERVTYQQTPHKGQNQIHTDIVARSKDTANLQSLHR